MSNPRQAILITDTDTVEVINLPNDTKSEYGLFSMTLDGYIEAVALDKDLLGLTLWVNEEGKLISLPFNSLATRLWEMSYGKTDVIMGNAIITGDADENGKTLGLTPNQINLIKESLGR